jgi:hypothetical protein
MAKNPPKSPRKNPRFTWVFHRPLCLTENFSFRPCHFAYLRNVIARIADHSAKRIAELLPWNIG